MGVYRREEEKSCEVLEDCIERGKGGKVIIGGDLTPYTEEPGDEECDEEREMFRRNSEHEAVAKIRGC